MVQIITYTDEEWAAQQDERRREEESRFDRFVEMLPALTAAFREMAASSKALANSLRGGGQTG
jgi:hypothetical protein